MAFDIHNPGKVLLTNLIHLLGFYICLEISAIINIICYHGFDSWLGTIGGLLLGIPFFLLSYGLIFIAAFMLAIVLLDLILFSFIKNNILLVMVIEWLVIVPIFIYWAFIYEYWTWIWLSGAFLITQYIRTKKIEKLLNKA